MEFSSLFSGSLPFDFDATQPAWEVFAALDAFMDQLEGSIYPSAEVSSHVELINPQTIYVAPGAKIEGFVRIVGPAYIGPNALIAHGALVRSGSLIMEGSAVGHCSEIKRSILFPGSKAAHFNYVGDSVIGRDVNLGAGAILCNQRLDKREVRIGGEETGCSKLGAFVGDGARVGAGVIINPGTILEKESLALGLSSAKAP